MCGSWRCAVYLLIGSLTLCECWAPAPYWRVLCASGNPNSSRWAVSLSFFGNPLCDGNPLHGTTMLTSDAGLTRCDQIHASFGSLASETQHEQCGYDDAIMDIVSGQDYDRVANEFVAPDNWQAKW